MCIAIHVGFLTFQLLNKRQVPRVPTCIATRFPAQVLAACAPKGFGAPMAQSGRLETVTHCHYATYAVSDFPCHGSALANCANGPRSRRLFATSGISTTCGATTLRDGRSYNRVSEPASHGTVGTRAAHRTATKMANGSDCKSDVCAFDSRAVLIGGGAC